VSGTLTYTDAGTYTVTMTAADASLSASETFSWTVGNTNRVPSLTNPGSQTALHGVGFALALTVVDPDGDPLTWSALNLPTGLTIETATGLVSGTPTALGTSVVVVTVSDGSASATDSFSLTVAAPTPGSVTPVGPSGTVGGTSPNFSWSATAHVSYYALSIADFNAASPVVTWYTPAEAGCATGTGTCSVPAPQVLAPGLVTWEVLTWNATGYGPWSTTATAELHVPDASVPTPDTQGPSGSINTRTPTYLWTAISSATWYELSVTDSLGEVREWWYTDANACVASACATTPNITLPNGAAHWTLRAWRSSGAGAWTPSVNFSAASAAPGAVTLVSPVSAVLTATPSFTWNAVAPTSYYLVRVTDRDDVTVDLWYPPTAAGCQLGTGTCTVSPGLTLQAGAASWQVLTWNAVGYGEWSEVGEFLIEISDPAAATPIPMSPLGAVVDTMPTYQWTAAAGALSYRLSIRRNGGAATYRWVTPAAAGCSVATLCSAVPPVTLLDGTMEWQVQAWTSAGYGLWSSPISLSVTIGLPQEATLIAPGGAVGNNAPSFLWSFVANTTYYYVRAFDSTGQRVDSWLTPSQAGCVTGGVCTLNAGVVLASGAGMWEVLAWNASGYGPWSYPMTFVIP
jgi:hypothetical protein